MHRGSLRFPAVATAGKRKNPPASSPEEASVPSRIRLRRTRGWRKPEGAVVVARPSRWGNPHRVAAPTPEAHEAAVEAFRADLLAGRLPYTAADVRRALAGRDLACWCAPELACHADVLLEVANGE